MIMEAKETVSLAAAFLAGFLTFLSPCILPLIPTYISYITGISFGEIKEAQGKELRKKTLTHSLLFILGFSAVFVALGASASFLGRLLFEYRTAIMRIGGIIVILFALYIMGVLKLDFLSREKRITFKLNKGSKLGSVLLGITFAAAWTPCAGPVLGSVLVLAATKKKILEGVWLLSIYSLGIALPLIISALFINLLLSRFAKLGKFLFVVRFICGLLLLVIGILLIQGRFILL